MHAAPQWLTWLLLAAFAACAWAMLAAAPPVERVAEVRLRPGDAPLIVGRAELGQRAGPRAAALDHLRLRHDATGWWIANLSDRRRVDAPTHRHATRYLHRWPLRTGARISLDGHRLDIVATDADGLVLDTGGGQARWASGRLIQPEPAFTGCPDEGTPWWRHRLGGDRELSLFSLGGEAPCPRRLRLPGVPVGGARILWRAGSFYLAPGKAEVRLQDPGAGAWQGFADLGQRLDDPADPTRRLILGRTHYRPVMDGETLRLIPLVGADRWPVADAAAPLAELDPPSAQRDPRVHIDWRLDTAPALGHWLPVHWPWPAAALTLALAGFLVVRRRPVRYGGVPRGLLALAVAAALLGGTLTLAPLPDPWLLGSIGLGWGLASLLLALGGRLRGPVGWLWVAAVGLVAAGALVQGQLGLGGDNDRWLTLAAGHWRLLALAGWLILPLTLVPRGRLAGLAEDLLDPAAPRWWRIARAALPVLAALVLLAQLAFGREEGLAGVQPVEGIKTLIALLLAYAGQRLWLRRAGLGDWHRAHPLRSALELTGLALVLLLFAAMLLWAVNDMSPALLLLLLALPLLWRLAPHPEGLPSPRGLALRGGLAVLVLAAVGLLAWVQAAPEQVPRAVPQYQRLMVWADPARHPESGHQVHGARALAVAGGALGTGPFGWNGPVMALPVVQNDFIGAFVLNRFGAIGATLVLALQLLFAGALFAIGRAVRTRCAAGETPRQRAGIFLDLALFALAWLFLAHALIAWGNVLGLLPVMGQPMTWLAAGNSHLLLFGLPTLLLGLAAGWLAGD